MKLLRGLQLWSRRIRRRRRGIGLGEAAASGDSTCIPALAPALTGEKRQRNKTRTKKKLKKRPKQGTQHAFHIWKRLRLAQYTTQTGVDDVLKPEVKSQRSPKELKAIRPLKLPLFNFCAS